jgi:hypothetical protein
MPVVFIVVLCGVVPAKLSFAQVITDLSYELGALSEPELLVDWSAAGLGTRAGIRVTTVGNTRTYTHSSLGLDNGEAFLMDVTLSAESLGSDGDRGARVWVRFRDASLPPMQVRHAEARLYRDGGEVRVGLFNSPTAPVSAPVASLPQDWRSASPRLRVRIRQQEVAGVPTIFFVVEDSTQWTPDFSGPLAPGATNTLSLPVDNVNFPGTTGSGEFGFGNYLAGDYYADYESVRIIRSSEADTVLPVAAALGIPALGPSGIAILVVLLAIGGWALVARPGLTWGR